jgi:Leucine-rich repeat (LRR) protein
MNIKKIILLGLLGLMVSAVLGLLLLGDIMDKTYKISIQTLINRGELPQIDRNGVLDLKFKYKKLTSLEGIQSISQEQRKRITRLDLTGNHIKEIPIDAFNGLINLKKLNLANNQIRTITAGSFNGLINLQELNLMTNQIRTVPANTFNGLINLKKLNLWGNQILLKKAQRPNIRAQVPARCKINF